MIIVCATDNNFVQHCCVMLASVLTNNSNVTVYLLTEGLTNENQKIIRQEIEAKFGIFHYIIVDSDVVSKLPMPGNRNLKHISPATYYRLLIPDLLPDEVHKAIYLDCDIVVRKSLEELWNIDISDYSLGAVHQILDEIVHAYRLGYPVQYGYFNAGVLLINVDYWRKNNIKDRLINYMIDNYKTIRYHDQDALNANLYDKTLLLPCKWNMVNYFFQKDVFKAVGIFNGKIINDYSEYKRMLKIDRSDPTIIHFVSKPKPWQKYCLHEFSSEYFYYAKETISFKGIQEPNKLINFGYSIFNNIFCAIANLVRPFYRKIKGSKNFVFGTSF